MYIRTKDGRILDFDKLNEVSKLSIDMAEEPIREADTIEELCDQIVYDYRLFQNKIRDGRLVEDSFEELDEPITDEMIKEGIYGAIWVDGKGLIYVAKMNSEGKLVLI